MMIWYLIVALIVISFGIGIGYGIWERSIIRKLCAKGWQERDIEEMDPNWETEERFRLPPAAEWLTFKQARRRQRQIDNE